MEHHQDYLTIDVDHDKKMITSNWLRFVKSQEFRAGMLFIEDCIVKDKLIYWLVDMTQSTAPAMIDQKWTIEHIMAVLEKTDMKKIAIVVPGDFILHMIGDRMRKKVYQRFGKKILLECFSRPDHALYWFGSAEETEVI